jgi:hypothetical protein
MQGRISKIDCLSIRITWQTYGLGCTDVDDECFSLPCPLLPCSDGLVGWSLLHGRTWSPCPGIDLQDPGHPSNRPGVVALVMEKCFEIANQMGPAPLLGTEEVVVGGVTVRHDRSPEVGTQDEIDRFIGASAMVDVDR